MTLHGRAAAAGVATRWKDAFGAVHDVSDATLGAVLEAVEGPAAAEGMRTTDVGRPVDVPGAWRLVMEDGTVRDGAGPFVSEVAGYHTLETGAGRVTLAVAPAACVAPGRAWGFAAQVYSLRRAGDGGLGDLAGLGELAAVAGAAGADAVAISPLHAQFSADPDRFSPYAPSSRVALNVMHAPVDLGTNVVGGDPRLVDYRVASAARLAALRARYAAGVDAGFEPWLAAQSEGLRTHALFEAVHARQFAEGRWHWGDWPDGLAAHDAPGVAAFAREHADEIRFHGWLQYVTDAALGRAQAVARETMRIGLISDLAVGVDGGGSEAWARGGMLRGLSIGAPPDLLSRDGQDWGLTTFDPRVLRATGYAAFLAMLRTAMRHAGGVRIDHIMGLARLWVIPHGRPSAEGTYLSMPHEDLLRLVALESVRHGAIVIGEDLGTLPEGFQEVLVARGILGLRVLMFERAEDEGFTAPSTWTRAACAVTSTHDLPTVSGWWQGYDIDWRESLALARDPVADREARKADRDRLWRAMGASGAAEGMEPPHWDGNRAVDAAVRHVAGAACELVLLPLEDALAVPEQSNVPGTLHEHPNWQRRLPGDVTTMLDAPDVAARIAPLREARP